MPQLDKFMFVSQIFWLCLFFITFYFYLLNFVIPRIFKVLRFRENKLNNFINNNYNIFLEEYLILNSYKNFLKSNSLFVSKFLVNIENKYYNWINNYKKDNV